MLFYTSKIFFSNSAIDKFDSNECSVQQLLKKIVEWDMGVFKGKGWVFRYRGKLRMLINLDMLLMLYQNYYSLFHEKKNNMSPL